MTLADAYREGLALAGPGTDRAFEVSCLFEGAFGLPRYAPGLDARQAGAPALERFFAHCRKLAEGEPLQYLLGEWEFFGLPFFVGEGVLIPQPDTETLVETALGLMEGTPSPVVADLCAGSGCVGISIAHMRPDARVYALELSEAALPYLARNIERNGAPVEALHCDALAPPALPPLDGVVSNPPYISREEMAGLPPQVKREPEMALYGGGDGLDFYRALPGVYRPLIKEGGFLALEVGYTQAEAVAALVRGAGFHAVETRRDLAGVARVVTGLK